MRNLTWLGVVLPLITAIAATPAAALGTQESNQEAVTILFPAAPPPNLAFALFDALGEEQVGGTYRPEDPEHLRISVPRDRSEIRIGVSVDEGATFALTQPILTEGGIVAEFEMRVGGVGAGLPLVIWPTITWATTTGKLDIELNGESLGNTSLTRPVRPDQTHTFVWKALSGEVKCTAEKELPPAVRRTLTCDPEAMTVTET